MPTGLQLGTPDDGPATAAWLISRLEEAGCSILALPMSGHTTHLRASRMEWAEGIIQNSDWRRSKVRPAPPTAAQISRMDQAFGWLSLIPDEKFVLRRVLSARSLINPLTGRYLFSWRRIATAVGADHKAVQRWHAQGIDLLVSLLNREPSCQTQSYVRRPARISCATLQ